MRIPIPRSARRSSTFRGDNGYFTCIITTIVQPAPRLLEIDRANLFRRGPIS